MSRCKLNLEDIRQVFKSIIPKWNHTLVRSKWLELKSKYTDDEIVTILNENKEKDVIIAIIKMLYKEIKNAHECEKELNKLIDELMKEKHDLEIKLKLKKDAKKQLRFYEIKKLIQKIKKVTNILPSQLKSLKLTEFKRNSNNTKKVERNNRYSKRDRESNSNRESNRESNSNIESNYNRESNSNTEQTQVSSTETNNPVAPIIQPNAETLGQMGQMGQMGTTYVDANYCATNENKQKQVCKRFNQLCLADKYNPICTKCLNPYTSEDTRKCIERAANPETNCYPVTKENMYSPYCTACLDNENLINCTKEKARLEMIQDSGTTFASQTLHLKHQEQSQINNSYNKILENFKKNSITPYYLYEKTMNNNNNNITYYEIEAAYD